MMRDGIFTFESFTHQLGLGMGSLELKPQRGLWSTAAAVLMSRTAIE